MKENAAKGVSKQNMGRKEDGKKDKCWCTDGCNKLKEDVLKDHF